MKRIIDFYLCNWKNDPDRKPLLLRGARQVGKTHAARKLGESFDNFVEINFELLPQAGAIFEQDLLPDRILQEISTLIKKVITPGTTLLFLDEIQIAPRAILALRYLYEMIPELHVIAAGSLLDFAIEKVGAPVGRVQFLSLYPLSFMEFLVATGKNSCAKNLLGHNPQDPLDDILHQEMLTDLGLYLAIGGMPQAVKTWIESKNPARCASVHESIIGAYRFDFATYANRHQVPYVELLFSSIPLQLGETFRYHALEGEFRKKELMPALNLLVTAGVAHKVYYSAGQGVPLGGQMDPLDYKTLFLDVALTQSLLRYDLTSWLSKPSLNFINKGPLLEAFIGQELLVYNNPRQSASLFYWHKETATECAEIDYLIEGKQEVIPLEVKSGSGRSLKSLHYFLESHQNSTYGVKLSTDNYSVFEKIHAYPLYALAHLKSHYDAELQSALNFLIEA